MIAKILTALTNPRLAYAYLRRKYEVAHSNLTKGCPPPVLDRYSREQCLGETVAISRQLEVDSFVIAHLSWISADMARKHNDTLIPLFAEVCESSTGVDPEKIDGSVLSEQISTHGRGGIALRTIVVCMPLVVQVLL